MSKRLMAFVVMVIAILAVALTAAECDAMDDMQGLPPLEERTAPPPCPPMDPSNLKDNGMSYHAPPELPPAKNGDMRECPPENGPVIVFDASGIPAHAPDKIKGFADAMDKKEKIDDKKHSFMIYDPSVKESSDKALFKALEAMGLQVISDIHELDEPYCLMEVTNDIGTDIGILQRFIQYVGAEDASLCNLINKMIQEMEKCTSDIRNTSLSREDEEPVLETLNSEPEEKEDSEGSETVYVVLTAPSAVETYLCSHVFDGGASESL